MCAWHSIFKILMAYFYFVCTNALPACLHVCMCVPGTQEGQKRDLDPLELESQTVGSCPVGTGG